MKRVESKQLRVDGDSEGTNDAGGLLKVARELSTLNCRLLTFLNFEF